MAIMRHLLFASMAAVAGPVTPLLTDIHETVSVRSVSSKGQ